MKNYCTSYQLYSVSSGGFHFPMGFAHTKSTLLKRAKKLGLSSYCIATVHTENFVSSIVKKVYYND